MISWAWVTNAYNTAKNVVTKVANTVVKASEIVNTVSSANVDDVKKSVSKKSSSSSWKESYNSVTDDLRDTLSN